MTTMIYAPPARVQRLPGTATRSDSSAPTVPVVVYGNRWCGLTQLIARSLARSGIDYDYVDLDQHPSVDRKLRALTGGGLRTPVVYVGGEWLVAPSTAQLRAALLRVGAAA